MTYTVASPVMLVFDRVRSSSHFCQLVARARGSTLDPWIPIPWFVGVPLIIFLVDVVYPEEIQFFKGALLIYHVVLLRYHHHIPICINLNISYMTLINHIPLHPIISHSIVIMYQLSYVPIIGLFPLCPNYYYYYFYHYHLSFFFMKENW